MNVTLINIKEDDAIAAVARVVHEDETETQEESDLEIDNGTEIENESNENQE